MDIVSIRELRQQAGPAGGDFRFHAQLDSVSRKTTKTAKPYYELKFVDSEESLLLRAWDNTAAFSACAGAVAKSFYAVEGQFYHNAERGGVDARDFSFRELNEEDTGVLLAGSDELRRRQARDYADIERLVDQIGDPRLRALGRAFLAQFGERLKRTGAARRNHHARRGGLVEHVAQMMRSAVQICAAYPMLNRDLLLSGVLFHDVGKLWENAYAVKGFTMPYTEGSELISHIPVGMDVVNRLWRELLETPEAAAWHDLEPASERVRLHLQHLIASHHGELQFGSPVVPKTPEAFALHYIDNLDAKLQMVFEAYEKAPEIGKHVFEKQWPLQGNLVKPLEHFVAPADSSQDAPDGETTQSEINPGDQLPIPEPDFGDEPLPDFEADEDKEEEPF